MSGYLTYLKTELIVGLQYKTSAIAGLMTQFFWGMIFAFIYTAFYSHASIDTINLEELMSYVWLGQAFFALTYLGLKDTEIINSIKNGTVAYELCRPYDLYSWWYIKVLAKRYSAVLLRCAPIILVSIFLPYPYNLASPDGIFAFLLFLISLLLGSFVTTAINMIVHTLSFYTMQDKGVSSIICTIGNLVGGLILPLPLLPAIINSLGEYLPFRLIGDLSFRVYSGNIGIRYALESIGLQFIWIILLILFGKVLMKNALKKVCIQGG